VKHRRRVDILSDVLAAAGKGERKTRIMQKANLSHQLLNKYLREALCNALLQSNSFGFELTEKGEKFLEQYEQLYEEHSIVGNRLEDLMSKWEALERVCPNRSDGDRRIEAAKEEDHE
jgi:predicted transcriptional regulator